MESQEMHDQQDSSTGTNDRSTVDFVYTDLDSAMDVAKAVRDVGGTACANEQLAAQLSLEAKGGGYRLRLLGAKAYGLITYERGGRVLLTDLGKRAVDPQREREARVEAFLAVELNEKVYEEFKGSPLPPPPAIERALVRLGVAEKQKEKARQVLIRSAKQAGFFELSQDRLTKPSIKAEPPKGENPPPPPPPPPNGGGGGGNYHPLIEGLLKTLPKEGDPWPIHKRGTWLNMANHTFNMIYQDEATSLQEISITLVTKSGAGQ